MIQQFTYQTVQGSDLKMTVYFPKGWSRSDSRTIVLFFFGGGWRHGDINQFRPQSDYLVGKGYVTALVDYRVQSRHDSTPYDSVCDGKAAVRWVRANATKLGIDPHQVVLAGGSAGGHVAACAALVPPIKESHIPNGLVLFNPVVNPTKLPKLYDDLFGEKVLQISPFHHVEPGAPPTIMFYGSADEISSVNDAEAFCEQMCGAGNVCELIVFHGKKHGFFNPAPRGDEKCFKQTLVLTELFIENLFRP